MLHRLVERTAPGALGAQWLWDLRATAHPMEPEVRATSEQCVIVNFAELLGRIRWGKMAVYRPKSSTKVPK